MPIRALDLPGPSRRIRVEPVVVPAPAREPSAPPPAAPQREPEPEVAPQREPVRV